MSQPSTSPTSLALVPMQQHQMTMSQRSTLLRSLLLVPKLKGAANYFAWRKALEDAFVLEGRGELWKILTGEHQPSAATSALDISAVVDTFVTALFLTTEPGPQLEMAYTKGPDGKYRKLKALYENPDAARDSIFLKIGLYKMQDFPSLPAYQTRVDELCKELEDTGLKVSEDLVYKPKHTNRH